MSSSEDVPLIGETLAGKYRIEKILGQGGMGVVMAARHLALNQYVAIKLLLPKAAKLPDATSRFLREAKIAASIQSEHVARVLDAGTLENGTPYIAMEHLGGVDLAHHLKNKGALPIEQAVDFMVQAGDAVAEAHSLGIVHRDLKPGNLFLTRRPDGTPFVKVLDFGLSKSMLGDEADGSLTQTGAVLGSPYYMSPEQLRSLTLVTVRSDVWAMGVILYELITGQRPFEGHSMTAICAAVIADKPAPPSSIKPEIPEALEAAILKCLEKDRLKRPETVLELMQALAPFGSAKSAQQVTRIARMFSPDAPRPDGPVENTGVTNILALGPPGGAPRNKDGAISGDGPSSARSGPTSARSGPTSSPRAPSSPGATSNLGSETVRIPSLSSEREQGLPAAHITGVVWGHTPAPAKHVRGARLAVVSAASLLLLMAVGGMWLGMMGPPEAPAAPQGNLAAAATPAEPEPAATLSPTAAAAETAIASETPPAATEAPAPAPSETASAEPPAPTATEASPAASAAPATPPAPTPSATAAKPPTTKTSTQLTTATAKTTSTSKSTTTSTSKTTSKPTSGKKHNPLDRSD